ncbi:MAG TPA: GNAT family N-acetyltransferase [Acidimicrobiales bacterium]|nr:GNAT family N-acetyltransferase [Acidimicrobiales bacterium]
MKSGLHLNESALSKAELTSAAQVASRAFYDDPFFLFLLPNDRLRERGLTIFFRANLAHLGEGARVVTVRSDDHAIHGVAGWLPTGCYPQSIPTQIAQVPGTLRALYRRPRALLDGNKYLAQVARTHPKEPHWYLYLLVADPSMQRSGVGTTLMEHGLAHADEEGVGSYLETQKEDNLAYYQRFGYELRDTLRPVKEGPPLFTMWRRPR